MAKRFRVPEPGVCYTVPMADGVSTRVGQIVWKHPHRKMHRYFLIYEPIIPLGDAVSSLAEVTASPPLLGGYFMREMLEHGQWSVLGEASIPNSVPFRAWAVGQPYQGRQLVCVNDHTLDYARPVDEFSTAPEFAGDYVGSEWVQHTSNLLVTATDIATASVHLPDYGRALLIPGFADLADTYFPPGVDNTEYLSTMAVAEIYRGERPDPRLPTHRTATAAASEENEVSEETSAVVRFELSGDEYGTAEERARVDAVEDGLNAALVSRGFEEVDGAEVGNGEAFLYLYNVDPRVVVELLGPLLPASLPRPIQVTAGITGPLIHEWT